MKVIAYVALHYGSDYLASAIHSVIQDIDELWVLYAAQGSHGTRTDAVCPDTRDNLLTIAKSVAGDKLRWYDGRWNSEGEQRDFIHALVPDADVVLVVDADEIWTPDAVQMALLVGRYQQARRYRMPMIHYWRSFNKAVLHDPAYPERVILPKVTSGIDTLHSDANFPNVLINHMGYAQRSEIVRYKLLTHGHIGQFRRDVNWFDDVFMSNRQVDCHPVGSEFWNPETVDWRRYLPEWMASHPYYGLDVIP